MTKMSIKNFVLKAEQQFKESINYSYRDIDMIRWQIDMLNNMLLRYQNKRSGNTLTHSEKQKEISHIREMIPEFYKTINFYKECINTEKKEMQRIHDTYGFGGNIKANYDDNCDDGYESNDSYNSYKDDQPFEDELEEIKEYKYNFATGVFE